MLKLTAPFEVVPGRQFDLLVDGSLGFIDEAADITSADVEFDRDAAARVFARNLCRAIDEGDVGELREGDACTIGRSDEQLSDSLHVVARRLIEPNDQSKALLALKDLPNLLARDDRLNHVVHIFDI